MFQVQRRFTSGGPLWSVKTSWISCVRGSGRCRLQPRGARPRCATPWSTPPPPWPTSIHTTGLVTNSIICCFLVCEKSLICLERQFYDPSQNNTFLFHSSQQLPCLCLRPLWGFLSWHGTLQGPLTCSCVASGTTETRTRILSGVPC